MYRVRWEIDLDAGTPEEAARLALASLRRPGTTATVFDVTDRHGKTTRVDLGAANDEDALKVLLDALQHAERRLNEIPHRYDDTNFRLIARAIELGKSCTD